jgi:hypothetical protein
MSKMKLSDSDDRQRSAPTRQPRFISGQHVDGHVADGGHEGDGQEARRRGVGAGGEEQAKPDGAQQDADEVQAGIGEESGGQHRAHDLGESRRVGAALGAREAQQKHEQRGRDGHGEEQADGMFAGGSHVGTIGVGAGLGQEIRRDHGGTRLES